MLNSSLQETLEALQPEKDHEEQGYIRRYQLSACFLAVSWQVSGQGSLFKLHAHPRPLVDYRSTVPTQDELAAIEQFYMVLFGEGVIMTPDLAGCLSTPMTEQDVDTLVAAADTAFGALERRE